MNSQLTTLGQQIQRKAMTLYHALMSVPDHQLNMGHACKTCDAYVVERLQKGASLSDVLKEVNRTFEAMLPAETFKKMVYFVEGYDTVTAVQKLQQLYALSQDESRLALLLLQLTTRRNLTAEPNTVEVTIEELVPA